MADCDIVTKGRTMIDGTRIRRYRGDIAVKDGRIAEISKISPTAASRVLAADRLMVALGFVDLQTQLDATYVKVRQAERSFRPCRPTSVAGGSRGAFSPPRAAGTSQSRGGIGGQLRRSIVPS